MRISDWSSDVCSSDLGDAQAIAGRIAKAFGKNDAKLGDYNDAGNDTIKAGAGHDLISGGSQAVAGGFARADQENHAGDERSDDYNDAGNDEIYAGNGWNTVAGDAQAIGTDSDSVAKAKSHKIGRAHV